MTILEAQKAMEEGKAIFSSKGGANYICFFEKTLTVKAEEVATLKHIPDAIKRITKGSDLVLNTNLRVLQYDRKVKKFVLSGDYLSVFQPDENGKLPTGFEIATQKTLRSFFKSIGAEF